MDYLQQELSLGENEVVVVFLDHAANVMLLDPANYQAYRNHRAFRYEEGGYARTTPLRLRAPQSGT